jgi:hypothetical protein
VSLARLLAHYESEKSSATTLVPMEFCRELARGMRAEKISKRLYRLFPPDSIFLPAKLFPQPNFQHEQLQLLQARLTAIEDEISLAKAEGKNTSVLEAAEKEIKNQIKLLRLPSSELPGLRFKHPDPTHLRRVRWIETIQLLGEYSWTDNHLAAS